MFDVKLKKKKKKKLTGFEIDDGGTGDTNDANDNDAKENKENQESEHIGLEDDEALDLESFGKKKKKKKKTFQMEDLDAALPDTKKEVS